MRTVATRAAVIDADVHTQLDGKRVMDFLGEPWRTRYAAGSRGAGLPGYWNPNGVMRSDAVTPEGERIERSPQALARYFFDVYGIEYGILNMGELAHALTPDPDYAAALASALNDVHIQDWLPADPRYRISLLVSPVDPQQAAREIHRVGDHPGVVQVIVPSASVMPYGQRFYHPIYAAAVEHNLPVAIHPGTEGAGITGAATGPGYPSRYLEWHTDLSAYAMTQLVSLVTEGVFQKFPTLKFVIIEAGVSWLPPLMWRLDKNWKALRQTTPWLERRPSEVIQERVLLTTQPLEEPDKREHFQAMLEMFDAAHMLMFSSDYPHWDGDTPDFAARPFPPALRPRVMSETARELYRLPPAAGEAHHA